VDGRRWKVGELAEAAGVTVRTLHHFDAIGLLSPAGRSAAGHRLYTADDVRRLYRVLALRQLGVPLAGIVASVESDGAVLKAVVIEQLDQVERQLGRLQQVHRQLLSLARIVQESREPSIDELLETMEATMAAGYFTPEQLARAKARHDEPGFTENFRRWQREAADVVRELGVHLGRGTDPADPAVQELALRWQGVMREMVDGDSAGLSSVYAKFEGKGPETATRGILTHEVWEYLKTTFAVGFGAGARPGSAG
jgi:DNA-binding transcriptional MerR regulator